MRIHRAALAREQIKRTGMFFARLHLSRAETAVTLEHMGEAVKDFQVAVPRGAGRQVLRRGLHGHIYWRKEGDIAMQRFHLRPTNRADA